MCRKLACAYDGTNHTGTLVLLIAAMAVCAIALIGARIYVRRTAVHTCDHGTEMRMSDCRYGCKVMACQCGSEVVEHRAAYGCPIGARARESAGSFGIVRADTGATVATFGPGYRSANAPAIASHSPTGH